MSKTQLVLVRHNDTGALQHVRPEIADHYSDVVTRVDPADLKVDYAKLTIPKLQLEIDFRNNRRDSDRQIAPEGKSKAALVAALEADDTAAADNNNQEGSS